MLDWTDANVESAEVTEGVAEQAEEMQDEIESGVTHADERADVAVGQSEAKHSVWKNK